MKKKFEPPMDGLADRMARAKAYPYPLLDTSYVVHPDGFDAIADGEALPDLAGRTPVLASGSNQSPVRLGTKFVDTADETLPVVRSRIQDFDSVYSAHFSSYGSVPSTIQHAPGTAATLFVTWLTPKQLKRMHETEALGRNYDYVRLDGVSVTYADDGHLDSVFAYLSRRGCIVEDGAPIPLARVPAENRRWTAMEQEEIIDAMRRRLQPDTPLDAFIGQHIDDEDIRLARCAALEAEAQAFTYERVEHLLP
jgi:hypothetical protein